MKRMLDLPRRLQQNLNRSLNQHLPKGLPGKQEVWIQIAVLALRLIVGGTFIFSGFVKAIDPWGTLYKFIDYMGAMHLPAYHNLLIVGDFALCCAEFVVGVCILLGCFRRSSAIIAMLFMVVMLPLTVWIAFWNPVSDCGCFGDAFIISNQATMWKNVALTIAIAFLIKYNTQIRCLVMPSLQWIAGVATTAYILAIALAGYIYQPLIDFRPYPIGSQIIDFGNAEDEEELDSEDNIRFIYAKDGIEKSFGIDDELPDESDGWEFIRREEESGNSSASGNIAQSDAHLGYNEASSGGSDAGNHNFRIWSEDGNSDVTEEVIPQEGKLLILFMPDLKNVSIATTWQINSLSSMAAETGVEMIGVVAGSREDISNWEDLSLASYPLYTADDTQIKMIARGNPAVVYIEDGQIVWKSTLRALDTADFLSSDANRDISSYARNNQAILYNFTGIFIAVILLLILLSLLPILNHLFLRK